MKKTIGDLRSCSLDSAQVDHVRVSACGEGGKIDILVYSSKILKIEYKFEGLEIDPELESAVSFIAPSDISELKIPKVSVGENDINYMIFINEENNPKTEIFLDKQYGTLSVFHGSTPVFGGSLGTKDTVIPAYPVRCLSENKMAIPLARFNFPLREVDSFYGLGDKAGPPDRRGGKFKFYNRDALGYDAEYSDPLYKSIPFFIKRDRANGYCCGVFFPSAWVEDMDFGKESPYFFKVEVKGGPFCYFLFLGPSYHDILFAYSNIAGFPALPPLFSFGFFGSSMNYVEGEDAAERILSYFNRVEKEGIPCEGMYVSSGYLKAKDGKRYAFLWNKEKFPDYSKFLRELAQRGYNLCMNIKPGILSSHPWYSELKDKGFLITNADGQPISEYFWGGEASFIDFDNPSAKDWWKAQLRDKYIDHGCSGIWNDNNELELEDPDIPMYKTKQLYPVKMAKTAYEAFKEHNPKARPWIYSRSGYAGMQRYARTWTGDNRSDWKTLRFNQYMGLALGISGMPFFGHDLGGFFGPPPSEELLSRSCQSAIFQSRFVIHSWREDGNPTEPWTYPSIKNRIQNYVLEHYRFIPYIYNCAIEASMRGIPIERPLFLEYPADKYLDDLDPHCLFGPSVLKVMVVREGESSSSIRLPSSDSWYDPIKQAIYKGGGTIHVDVPFEGARWLAKTGSVIPTSPGLNKLKTAFFDFVEFLVFPPDVSGETSSIYYEDDGITELNLGQYNKWAVSISYDKESGRGQIQITEEYRGGVGEADSRIFRFSLPPSFHFEKCDVAEVKIAQLGRVKKLSWEFHGRYRA